MHKQDHTTTDKGLDTIVESMYSEDCGPLHASKEPFVRKKGPDKKFKKHHLDKLSSMKRCHPSKEKCRVVGDDIMM